MRHAVPLNREGIMVDRSLWMGLGVLVVCALLVVVLFVWDDLDQGRRDAHQGLLRAIVERDGRLFLDVRDAQGRVTSSTEYKVRDGKPVIDGEQTFYRADGSVSLRRKWANGKDTGEYEEFDTDGNIIRPPRPVQKS